MNYFETDVRTAGFQGVIAGIGETYQDFMASSFEARVPKDFYNFAMRWKQAIEKEIPTRNTIEAAGFLAKSIERRSARNTDLSPISPIMARLDLRAGHTLTRGLDKPVDKRFRSSMLETAEGLIRSRHALGAYVQSDEITLIWIPPEVPESDRLLFGGRSWKWLSTLAGEASSLFTRAWIGYGFEGTPHFDCRLIQGTHNELISIIEWRAADAFRNSILSCGQAWIGKKQIFGLSNVKLLQCILDEHYEKWTTLSRGARFGATLMRRVVERELTSSEFLAIPVDHRPASGTLVKRTGVLESGLEELYESIHSSGTNQ